MMSRRILAVLCTASIIGCLHARAEDTLDVPARFDEVVGKGNAAVAELVAALQGPQANRAAAALGRIGSPQAVAALLPLAASPEGEMRATVAWALGSCKDPAATPALLKLAEDPHAPARAGAFWALGRVGNLKSADALRRGTRDPDRNVRLALARGIAEGGQKAFFSVLTPRLDYDARWVLEPGEDGKIKEGQKPVEKVFWTEPDTAVRLAIVQALGTLGVIDAAPSIIYAMEREASFNRLACVAAIESFGPKAAGACLGRIVPTPYDKDAFDRRMPLLINNGTLAVIAGRLGDKRCVPYLLKTLKLPQGALGRDKDLTELYIQTVELLGGYKVEQAARPLAEMLKTTRVGQLSKALQAALLAIGRPAARPLARNADDWSLAPVFMPLLREPALRTRTVRDTLVKFLAHESDEVRREATDTLGLYIYEGVLDQYDIPLLEGMYLDPDRSVRQVCAKWKNKIAEKFGEGSVK